MVNIKIIVLQTTSNMVSEDGMSKVFLPEERAEHVFDLAYKKRTI